LGGGVALKTYSQSDRQPIRNDDSPSSVHMGPDPLTRAETVVTASRWRAGRRRAHIPGIARPTSWIPKAVTPTSPYPTCSSAVMTRPDEAVPTPRAAVGWFDRRRPVRHGPLADYRHRRRVTRS